MLVNTISPILARLDSGGRYFDAGSHGGVLHHRHLTLQLHRLRLFVDIIATGSCVVLNRNRSTESILADFRVVDCAHTSSRHLEVFIASKRLRGDGLML